MWGRKTIKEEVKKEESIVFGKIVKRSSIFSDWGQVYYELTERNGEESKTSIVGMGFGEAKHYKKDDSHPLIDKPYLVGYISKLESWELCGHEIRSEFSREEIWGYLVKRVSEEKTARLKRKIDDGIFVKDLENVAGGEEWQW